MKIMSRMCRYLTKNFLFTHNPILINRFRKQIYRTFHSFTLISRNDRTLCLKTDSLKVSQIYCKCSSDRTMNGKSSEFEDADDESFDSDFLQSGFYLTDAEERKKCSFFLRNQLFPNSNDTIIVSLKESCSEQEVFNILKDNYSLLSANHISQSLLVLRDLQLLNGTVNPFSFYHSSVYLRPKNSNTFLANSNETNLILNDPFFPKLLEKIDQVRNEFNINPLASSVLYLHKLGLPLRSPTMISLLFRLEDFILSTDCSELPVSALSKYSSIIRSHYGYWSSFFLADSIAPKAEECLGRCTHFLEVKHIAKFFSSNLPLLSESIKQKFRDKLFEILEFTNENSDIDSILKIMHFINQAEWRTQNHNLILQLLNLISKSESVLTMKQLVDLTKMFPGNSEPYHLMSIFKKAIPKLEASQDNKNEVLNLYVHCVASNYNVKLQHNLQNKLKEKLMNSKSTRENMLCLNILYVIARNMKTGDKQLYSTYWSNIVNLFENAPGFEKQLPKLLRLANKYMVMQSKNLKLRNYRFEKRMCSWLMHKLNNDVEKFMPSIFSRIFAFLLAYGNFWNEEYPDAFFKKLKNSTNRLSLSDQFFLSVSLYLAVECRGRLKFSSIFLQQSIELTNALNNSALNYLKSNPSISSSSLGMILHSYILRHRVVDSELLQEILNRYKSLKTSDLTPRLVYEILSNFQKIDCFLPELLETIALYIVETNEVLKASIAVKVLDSFYNFAYTPKCADAFFPVVTNLINREKESLRSPLLIRNAIALSYFYQLPFWLIQYIFNIQFLDALDEEIKLSSISVLYTKKVRHYLMELNRTVCLDYPDQDIPWFHARYCEEIASIESPKVTAFHEDVSEILLNLLGDRKLFQQNVYSPYSYKIDFEILFDHNGIPVEPKLVKNPAICSRVAILFLQKKDLTHPNERPKGYLNLRQRHLELMGYHIVSITPGFWNTMFMAEKDIKTNYLQKQIWSKLKSCS